MKRMTVEEQATLMLLPPSSGEPFCNRCGDAYTLRAGDDPTPLCNPCAHEVVELLNEALSAERAHCELLRQRNIERNEKHAQRCSCCRQCWAYGAPELHLDGCIAAP